MKILKIGLLAASLVVMATAASAADLRPVLKAPPAPPPPPFSWTGFYIGGHVGGGWSTTEATLKSVTVSSTDREVCGNMQQEFGQGTCTFTLNGFSIPLAQTQANGFLGGAQAGYNFQVNSWAVLGIEGDFSWTDIKGASPCLLILSCSTDHDWVATLAGRVGVTYDRALLYLKGGAAWAQATYAAALNLGFLNARTEVSDTRFGWMVGTGLEYAFLPNWSAKIEYNFIDFGDKDYTFPVTAGPVNLGFGTTINEKMHLVKAGVNYRFGGF